VLLPALPPVVLLPALPPVVLLPALPPVVLLPALPPVLPLPLPLPAVGLDPLLPSVPAPPPCAPGSSGSSEKHATVASAEPKTETQRRGEDTRFIYFWQTWT
jgi:hypothetical protein